MKRTAKTGTRASKLSISGGPVKVGKVTLGSTRRPAEPKRQGSSTGRIETALASSKKKTTPPASKKRPTSKAISRWEDEGGQPLPDTKSQKAPLKKVVKKAKPKPKPEAASFLDPITPDRSRQRKVESEAKIARIQRAGIDSRLLGHASGSGRRKQASRDSKN